MAGQTITEFDSWSIKNPSIQFIKNGTQQDGIEFGGIGKLSFEPETSTLTKKVGRVVVKEKVITTKLNVSVSAHIPINVYRDFFGLSNQDLKPGVYSYGETSLGETFVFTAEVVDDFENVTKLVAFPNASNAAGLTLTIDSAQEELAMLDLSFAAVADKKGQFYYEALVPEIDEAIAQQWHTKFTRELVEEVQEP